MHRASTNSPSPRADVGNGACDPAVKFGHDDLARFGQGRHIGYPGPESRPVGVRILELLECVFALHTSELMHVALPMYRRMGFKWFSAAPDIHGVRYGIYLKNLNKDEP